MLINSDSVHKHKLLELPDPKRGRGWRWLVAGYISAVYSEINFGREIYVFGVAGGNSIGQIRMAMKEYGLPIPRYGVLIPSLVSQMKLQELVDL